MDTGQYTLSEEIPYGLVLVSSPKYDRDYCFKLGKTMISGKKVEYYEDGNKEYEDTYRNCKRNGTSTYYHENGDKFWENRYENDKLHGLETVWHDNKNKFRERTYKNDKLDGISTCWDNKGNKKLEQIHKDGVLLEEKYYK